MLALNMHYVQSKTTEQQNLQSLLRVRQGYIETRTKISNQIRGLLAEYGIIFKKGVKYLQKELPILIDRSINNGLSIMMKDLLKTQYNMLLNINEQIAKCDVYICNIANTNEACQRLQNIEGIGIITVVAILALVGDGKGFKNGRHYNQGDQQASAQQEIDSKKGKAKQLHS